VAADTEGPARYQGGKGIHAIAPEQGVGSGTVLRIKAELVPQE
jgi:hypothetical protein